MTLSLPEAPVGFSCCSSLLRSNAVATMSPSSIPTESPVQKTNDMYQWTRHVYDRCHRYYLLGRDQLLTAIAEHPGGRVLEIGCGTARNLCLLDENAPQHDLYGLSSSLSALATAREKLDCRGCTKRITLGHGRAHNLDPPTQLRVEDPFDIVFFSYVLSMIPAWPDALRAALTHLSSSGTLYIVDFWDQADFPDWIAHGLQQWLSLFDVHPRPDLIDTLRELDTVEGLSCTLTPVARRYAYQATIQLSSPLSSTALEMLDGTASTTAKQVDDRRPILST